MRRFHKIGKSGKSCVAGAFVVESAVAQKGELGAVVSKLIDLTVMELKGADDLWWLEKRGTITHIVAPQRLALGEQVPCRFSSILKVGKEAGAGGRGAAKVDRRQRPLPASGLAYSWRVKRGGRSRRRCRVCVCVRSRRRQAHSARASCRASSAKPQADRQRAADCPRSLRANVPTSF
jgi:hypothetical protein